ncbi:MAG: flippase-like domain-containing protein [Chitinispirillaceae bacterium]|nr:flippase-like domain-containing protein [Chitinispirillaceae bacterium]
MLDKKKEIFLKIKKKLITTTKVFITIAIIFLLLKKLGCREIVSVISTAEKRWLIVSFFVFLLSTLIGVIQWKILLNIRNVRLTWWHTIKLYMIGMFFNNFVFGGLLGDVLRVASIKAHQGKGKAGLAATFLDRFIGLWVMSGFAVAGSFVLVYKGSVNSWNTYLAMIALFSAFFAFVLIALFIVAPPFQKVVLFIIERLPFRAKTKLMEIFKEIIIESHEISILWKVLVLSLIIQLLRTSVHIFTACSLQLFNKSKMHYFFIIVPIIAVLMTIPMPFGVREATAGALFSLAGFQPEKSYVMGFLASIIGLAASLIGGVFYITETTFVRKRDEKNINSNSSLQ